MGAHARAPQSVVLLRRHVARNFGVELSFAETARLQAQLPALKAASDAPDLGFHFQTVIGLCPACGQSWRVLVIRADGSMKCVECCVAEGAPPAPPEEEEKP